MGSIDRLTTADLEETRGEAHNRANLSLVQASIALKETVFQPKNPPIEWGPAHHRPEEQVSAERDTPEGLTFSA